MTATAEIVDFFAGERQPCLTCAAATGDLCGYCGRSLGCRLHKTSIDEHVRTCCLATPDDRAVVDAMSGATGEPALDAIVRGVRARAATPWPSAT